MEKIALFCLLILMPFESWSQTSQQPLPGVPPVQHSPITNDETSITCEKTGFTITALATTPTLCGEPTGTAQFELLLRESIDVQLWIDEQPHPLDDVIESLSSGDHNAVLLDAAGCRLDTIFTIERTGCPIYIPNVFSPNRDGINDYFQIETADEVNVTIRRFFVFDRWGVNVYERYNVNIRETGTWWDGTYKRFIMDPGVYAYYIEVEFQNGDREVYKGDVTLVR